MKKITILFICSIFTISTFAQEKKEPTKKETFDFIVYMLKKSMTVELINSDFKNESIEVNAIEELWAKNKNIKTFKLSELDVVKKSFGIAYIDSNVKYPRTQLRFKSNSNYDDFLNIAFETSESEIRDKLFKALNHWIKLSKGVDTGLFDD